jgi:tetratricopeptide (TPR) repeat protein
MSKRTFALWRNAALVAVSLAMAVPPTWSANPLQHSQAPDALARGLQELASLLHAGSFPEAESTAKKLRTQFPRSSEVEQAYAAALEGEGKLEEATAHLQHAIELAPNSPAAHLNLGSNYFRRGMTTKAREQFDAATRLNPGDATAFYNAGLADLKLEDFGTALEQFQRAHKLAPDAVEISYYLAMSYVIGAKAQEALSLIRSLPEDVQGRPEFQILNIAATSATGRTAGTDSELQRVLTGFATPKAYASAAVLFLTAGDYGDAVRVMEAANAKYPADVQIEYLLATAYSRAHQLQPALATLQAALTRSDSADLHALYGKLLEEQGDSVKAVHELQRAAELDPSEANINAWGVELLDHWTFDAAIAVFQSGLNKHPDSQALRTGLAIAYFAAGNYDDAVKTVVAPGPAAATDGALSVLMAAYPNSHASDVEVRTFTRAYARQHPASGSASYYAALAITEDPSHTAAPAERQDAIRLLERAVSLDPKAAQFHYQLGVALSDAGQWSAALGELRETVKLDPKVPEAWYRLALAAKRTGNIQEGEEALARYTAASNRANSELQNRMAQTKKFVASLPK